MLNRIWNPTKNEPTRNLNYCHYGRHIVFFPSKKNNKQIICESHLEATYCVMLEHDKHVKHYYPQPVTSSFISIDRQIKYTPDFFVTTHDQVDYFVEVKNNFDLCSASYMKRLQNFEQLAAHYHYDFHKIDQQTIYQDTCLPTICSLYFKSLHVSPSEYYNLLRATAALCEYTMIELLQLPSPASVRAIAHALFVGDLHANLNQPLTLQTKLSRSRIS
jgi:hypothetical protein